MTPPSQTSDGACDAGFTLVELLIGLVLLSLIAVLLAGAMNGARRGLNGLEPRLGDANVEVVQTHLRAVISSARPVRLPEHTQDGPLIDGQRELLRFISGFSPAGQYGGLTQVDLELTPGTRPGLWHLNESRTLYRPALETGARPPERPRQTSRLFADIAAFELLYFGKPAGDDDETPKQWRDTWSDRIKLPELVAINITFAPGDPRRWPTLIIPMPSGH